MPIHHHTPNWMETAPFMPIPSTKTATSNIKLIVTNGYRHIVVLVELQIRVKLVAATNVYRSRDVKLDGYM